MYVCIHGCMYVCMLVSETKNVFNNFNVRLNIIVTSEEMKLKFVVKTRFVDLIALENNCPCQE